jgi:hypothetical protein
MLCAGWRCGGVKVLPLLSALACKVCLQCLSKISLRRHAFCFLPLVTILENQERVFKSEVAMLVKEKVDDVMVDYFVQFLV